MNGLQSKVEVVGCAPKRTYRSASPVPPLICTVSDACPAGTAMKKNCCELVAPERFVTATPFCNWVSPFAAVTVTEALALWLTVPDVPVTVNVAVVAAAVEAAVRVRVELPPAVTETTAVEVVLVPVAFCPSVSALGLAEMEKSFVATAPQFGNLKDPIRVFQLKVPFAGRYSVVYQKVQSSDGSTAIIE